MHGAGSHDGLAKPDQSDRTCQSDLGASGSAPETSAWPSRLSAAAERNRFAFDPLARVPTGVRRSVGGCDLHSGSEQALQIVLEGRLLEQTSPAARIDEDVKIAVGPDVALADQSNTRAFRVPWLAAARLISSRPTRSASSVGVGPDGRGYGPDAQRARTLRRARPACAVPGTHHVRPECSPEEGRRGH